MVRWRLAGFEDDFLDEQAGDGHVHGSDDDHPAGLFAVEGGRVVDTLGAVGAKDEVDKRGLFAASLLLYVLGTQVADPPPPPPPLTR